MLGNPAYAFDLKRTRLLCIHAAYGQKSDRKQQMRLVEIECVTGWSASTLDRNLRKFGKREDLYGDLVPSGNTGERGNRNWIQCYDLDKVDAWLAAHYPSVHKAIHKALDQPAPDGQSLDAKQTVEQSMSAKLVVILRTVQSHLDEGRLDLAREALSEHIAAAQASTTSSFATSDARRLPPDQWAIDRMSGSFEEYVEAVQAGGVLSTMTLAEAAAWPVWASEPRRQEAIAAWVSILRGAEEHARQAISEADAHRAVDERHADRE